MTVVFIHGTPHRKCTDGPNGKKCDVCLDANLRYRQKRTEARQRALAADPSIRPHGNYITYQSWGCRCDPCTQAATAKRDEYGRRDGKGRLHPRATKRRAKPFGREWIGDES